MTYKRREEIDCDLTPKSFQINEEKIESKLEFWNTLLKRKLNTEYLFTLVNGVLRVRSQGDDTPLKCCYMVVCSFFFSRRSFPIVITQLVVHNYIGLDSDRTINTEPKTTLIRTKQKQHMLLWNNCLLTPLNLFTFNTKYSKRIFLSTPPNPLIDNYRAS